MSVILNHFNLKSFDGGFHRHSQESSNIFKKADFVREFKIPSVYLNELRLDYIKFGLICFYKYVFLNGFDK